VRGRWLAAVTLAALGTTPAASAADHAVAVVDSAYQPAQVTISPGDTVVWTDRGSLPHTITAADGSFDSHPQCSPSVPVACMRAGETFRRTFDRAGTVSYYCKIHGTAEGGGMAGRVVVQAPPPTTTPPTAPPTAPAPPSDPPPVGAVRVPNRMQSPVRPQTGPGTTAAPTTAPSPTEPPTTAPPTTEPRREELEAAAAGGDGGDSVAAPGVVAGLLLAATAAGLAVARRRSLA
jgi:plastocyanin